LESRKKRPIPTFRLMYVKAEVRLLRCPYLWLTSPGGFRGLVRVKANKNEPTGGSAMRIGWASIAAAVICGAVGIGTANAAEPTQIKVGILLPLTGPFAAVAETQKQGALLAVDVINKRGGLNMPWGRVKVARRWRAPLSLHGVGRR
jgi:Periplasmic binding protein